MNQQVEIEQELNNKSLEELLFIYYNQEKFISKYINVKKQENDKIIEEIKKKNKELQDIEQANNNLKNTLFSLQAQLQQTNQKVNVLFGDSVQMRDTLKKIDEENLRKYQLEKDRLLSGLKSGLVTYNEFKEQIRNAAYDYSYVRNEIMVIQKSV